MAVEIRYSIANTFYAGSGTNVVTVTRRRSVIVNGEALDTKSESIYPGGRKRAGYRDEQHARSVVANHVRSDRAAATRLGLAFTYADREGGCTIELKER